MKSKIQFFFLSLLVLSNVGCISAALEASKKIPAQEDVAKMKIGETKQDEVSSKWPDFEKLIVNDKICLSYSKANAAASFGLVGGKVNMISLCFKDGVMTDKNSN